MRASPMMPTFFLIVLATHFEAVAAEDMAAKQLFDEVVKMRILQAQAITSVQGNCDFSMVDDYSGVLDKSTPDAIRERMVPDGKPQQKLDKKITFGRMGAKHFDMERGAQNDAAMDEYHTTFDGTTGHVRRQGTGMVSMGRSPDTHRPGTPQPPSFLEPLTPGELGGMLDRNELQLLSGTRTNLDGRQVLKFSFRTIKDTPGSRTDICYAPQDGYLPILTRHYDPEGHVRSEVTDVQVGHFTVMGNEACYPLSITHKAFHDGKQYRTSTLRVDAHSLVFNASIPDDQFTIVPKPDEWLWDADLQLVVLDPGKQIDLQHLVKTPFIVGQPTALELSPATTRSTAASAGEPALKRNGHRWPMMGMLALIALGVGIILARMTWKGSNKVVK